MSNIITIKIPLINDITQEVVGFQRKYNNVVRYTFNRFMEGHSRTEVFNLIKTLNNVNELDVTWRREAAKLAESLAMATKKKDEDEQTVIFGGRKWFKKRLRGKISSEEYKEKKKLMYISCEGSKSDTNGNRKFKFNVETFEGSVKLDGRTVNFACKKIRNKNLQYVRQAVALAEEGEIGMTYRLSGTHFYICVDLEKLHLERYSAKKNVTLALDMNPNYIGLSIVGNNEEVMLRKVYDLNKIGDNNNKRKHELTEIAKSIALLCRHYCVEYCGYEKLSMKSGDKGKGRRYNKMVNNNWDRERFVNSLRKWLGVVGCKFLELAPQYSSFIGCITHEGETDSVAASIELNRRLREFKAQYIDKTKPRGDVIFPPFQTSHFNRWKESFGNIAFDGWKEAYQWFKETEHSYRLTYNEWLRHTVARPFRYKSLRSLVFAVTI